MANKNITKPRIAVLANAFWNSGAGISGGDQRLMQIFSRIGKDFVIDVYTSVDGKKVIQRAIKDANFIISPKNIETGNLVLRYWKRSSWLTGELKNTNYDLIYSSSDFFPDVTPAYYYKKHHAKTGWIQCVFHIYPNWLKRPGSKILNLVGSMAQGYSLKKIGKLANRVININYQVRDELIKKWHFKPEKIEINPCGIDLEYFRKIKATKKPHQACFIARLAYSKGIFDLPEIWNRVVRENPKAILKIIGGGSPEIKTKLQDEFDQRGISKSIEILGFLPNDQAYKILKESSLFVFPSHEEGFGIAIAEAMACEVPVAAWQLPVYAEVFPKAIVSTEMGDLKQLAKGASKILNNPKEAKKLVDMANKVIKQYSWQEIANSELKIINALSNGE
jgi:glycosyltransferase involved in cell wall biosynthesis